MTLKAIPWTPRNAGTHRIAVLAHGGGLLAAILLALALTLGAAFAQHAGPAAQGGDPLAPQATTDGTTPEAATDDTLDPSVVGLDPMAAMVDMPLAPAPTSSPRQTFRSFRALTQGAERSLLNAFTQSANDKSLFDTAEVQNLKNLALEKMGRATSTLDLSAVPPANRRTVGISAILQLEEIFERIPLPDIEDIPGREAVDEGAVPNGWTIPGTEIRLSRSQSGSGEVRFLFSSETVQRLPAFYALVKDMPRPDLGLEEDIDFYQHFVRAPGLSMPIEVYRYVLNFPDWLLVVYNEQSVWQWIALVVLTAIVGGIVYLLLRWEARVPAPDGGLSRALRRLVTPILLLALLLFWDWAIDNAINMTGAVLADLELGVATLEIITLSVIALFAANALAALIIASPRIRSESLDASLIRLVLRVVGLVVAGFIIFHGATQVGVPAYGIVAGLGVGGLAIALAVRPTLENFIGGIILYADRPVKVGDFCKFGNMVGTVEEIGLRSTKVRSLDRTLVTVQNSEFAQMSLTNYTRRDRNLMHTTIGLRYETSPAALTAIIDNLSTMLRDDPRVAPDTVRVCFVGFGTFSLDIEIWCYVLTADWTTFLKIKQDLYLKVMDIIEAGGSSFAFPSQTTYLGTDQMTGSGEEPDTIAARLADARPA